MNQPNDAVNRGIEIKLQIRKLDDEYKMISPLIIKGIRELSAGKEKEEVEIEGIGKYFVTSKKKWEYSEKTKNLKKELDKAKKEEEADGTAKIIAETEFPQFNPIKNVDSASR